VTERVLVTGGAGFIGSHLVDRLVADGHKVIVVDDLSSGRMRHLESALASGRVTFLQMDVRSKRFGAVFHVHLPTVVVHLAAQIDVRRSVADPILDADVNVLGTLNVLEHARRTGARKVLVASSGGCVYGEPRSLPVKETAQTRPLSPYGISKRVLHDYLAFYDRTHGLSSTVLALSNVYGPRQDAHGEAGVVAIFLHAMLVGEKTTIFGDGSQTRDFVYVDDVVEAFMRSMDAGSGVLNIGTGAETSVMELWRHCAEVTGSRGRGPRHGPARPGELQRNAVDPTRAGKALGWRPLVALRDGLLATAEHLRTEIDAPATSAV
jgi:UDP-glucose 4-epimerase